MPLFVTQNKALRPTSRSQSRHHISRQHRNSHAQATMDKVGGSYFMDVGAWQGGGDGNATTTFGLVCGYDAVLCTWMGLSPGEQDNLVLDHCIGDAKINGQLRRFTLADNKPIAAFLRHAFKQGRGFVLQWTTADAHHPSLQFAATDTLMVIVPDLHLHAFTDQPVDRFRYKPEGTDQLTSLDQEMRSLLDVARRCDAATLQVGDLYEVWEVELLLRAQYSHLLRRKASAMIGGKDLSDSRPDLTRMVETGKVVPQDMTASDYTDGSSRVFSDHQIERRGVDFRSTDDLCRAIREAHPDLFCGQTKLVDYLLHGNHDNYLENPYWPKVAPELLRNNPYDQREMYGNPGYLNEPTAGSPKQRRSAAALRVNGERRTWIEHGHVYDWHNNDRDWWKARHGFDMVHDFLFQTLSEYTGPFGTMIAPIVGKTSPREGVTEMLGLGGGDWALSAASEHTRAQDYHMRLPELRRTDELFLEHKTLRLVIMGHTHHPDAIAGQNGRARMRFDHDYESWSNYRDGEYWLKKAESQPQGNGE